MMSGLAEGFFPFDRGPLVQRMMLVVMSSVFLDATVYSADRDVLFVIV